MRQVTWPRPCGQLGHSSKPGLLRPDPVSHRLIFMAGPGTYLADLIAHSFLLPSLSRDCGVTSGEEDLGQ